MDQNSVTIIIPFSTLNSLFKVKNWYYHQSRKIKLLFWIMLNSTKAILMTDLG
jgi:hypothetical protein